MEFLCRDWHVSKRNTSVIGSRRRRAHFNDVSTHVLYMINEKYQRDKRTVLRIKQLNRSILAWNGLKAIISQVTNAISEGLPVVTKVNPVFKLWKLTTQLADLGDREVKVVGLRPLYCWDCGFESYWGHTRLSLVFFVYLNRWRLLWRADRSFRGVLSDVSA